MADELKNLVDAGLTPYQALSGATSAPARFLNQPARFGRVAIGARADLLLLEGNPLEDVGQVRRPTGVVVRGAWYDRQQLDRLLERSTHRLDCSGNRRIRRPVSTNSALATAGAMGGTPASPTPVGGASLRKMWTAISGMRSMRSTG